jgi:CelD/BcsL family acetyltransferase involved in cellulose biosynthesis
MEFSLITSPDEIERMRDEWNTLLAASASHVPFLRSDYQLVWWKTKGGGEWANGALNVALAREGGRLVGIAPLFFTHNRDGEPALMLIGSVEISDYLDVIARTEDIPAFIEGLLTFLNGPDVPAWRVLDWYNILDTSPTLPALERASRAHGWDYAHQRLQHSPYIPLPGDWEAYLGSIEKKQRHEIRRKIRRLENSGLPWRWYIVEDDSRLDAEMEELIALMVNDPDKAGFMTQAMRETFLEIARQACREGYLQLSFLEIDGRKAAGCIAFDYQNRIWVYNSGLNHEFVEYSPGWVLIAFLLRWANEHKRLEFDFLRGNEEYKYRFGAIDRFIVRAQVRRE